MGLLSLVVFLAIWDLWALSQDRMYRGSDTYLQAIINLDMLYRGEGGSGWAASLGPKGPLAPVLGWFLLKLVGTAWAAGRLLAILCHLLLVFQCHDLGRRLGGTQRAGLLSAALCGLSPMVYGWGRLAFHDILVAVMVALSLQVMLRVDLSRWRQAALLGVVLGLGMMSKLSFVIFMIAPGLWFLATRVRGKRQVAGLGITAAAAVATCGWWLVPIIQETMHYVGQSAARPEEDAWWAGLHHYLDLPGVGLIVAGAVVGTVALWRLGRHHRRAAVWALFGSVLISLLIHGMVASLWSRYLVPLVPLAAVLCGAGLALLLARIPPVLARAAAWGLTACLLGAFVGTNVTGSRWIQGPRTGDAGMVSPDPRAYRGYPKAARAWGPSPGEISWSQDSNFAMADCAGIDTLWHAMGLKVVESETPLRERARPFAVMLVRHRSDEPVQEVEYGGAHNLGDHSGAAWLIAQKDARRIWTAMDPDGLVFQAYWVGR